MTYTVTLAPAAQRDIRKLEAGTQRRIVRKLEDLAEDPRGQDTLKLQGEDLYRVRVGDFCIVYAIADDVLIVTVVRVRDRKDVYR